jgi:hypothetical protein
LLCPSKQSIDSLRFSIGKMANWRYTANYCTYSCKCWSVRYFVWSCKYQKMYCWQITWWISHDNVSLTQGVKIMPLLTKTTTYNSTLRPVVRQIPFPNGLHWSLFLVAAKNKLSTDCKCYSLILITSYTHQWKLRSILICIPSNTYFIALYKLQISSFPWYFDEF